MSIERNRVIYFVTVIFVMMLGLSARHFSEYLPNWINLYLGDVLWALMIFFIFGLVFRTGKTRRIAILALLFSFGIEISQLYDSPWLNTLRDTRLGRLILGYGFLWSDLVAYCIGIGMGVYIEKFAISKRNSI